MEYKKLHGFILFVLLHDGKSNLGYRICRFVFGERAATRRYFRILFSGCDNATFMHYQDLYKKDIDKDFCIKVEVDSHNLLTGGFSL